MVFVKHDDPNISGSFSLGTFQCFQIVIRAPNGDYVHYHTNQLSPPVLQETNRIWQSIIAFLQERNIEVPLNLTMEIHGGINYLQTLPGVNAKASQLDQRAEKNFQGVMEEILSVFNTQKQINVNITHQFCRESNNLQPISEQISDIYIRNPTRATPEELDKIEQMGIHSSLSNMLCTKEPGVVFDVSLLKTDGIINLESVPAKRAALNFFKEYVALNYSMKLLMPLRLVYCSGVELGDNEEELKALMQQVDQVNPQVLASIRETRVKVANQDLFEYFHTAFETSRPENITNQSLALERSVIYKVFFDVLDSIDAENAAKKLSEIKIAPSPASSSASTSAPNKTPDRALPAAEITTQFNKALDKFLGVHQQKIQIKNPGLSNMSSSGCCLFSLPSEQKYLAVVCVANEESIKNFATLLPKDSGTITVTKGTIGKDKHMAAKIEFAAADFDKLVNALQMAPGFTTAFTANFAAK